MSSKAINNSKKTKSKKKLEEMGNSTSSKDGIVKGEAKLLTTEPEVEKKTNGQLLVSALKGAKKSATKMMKSFSPTLTDSAKESLESKEVEASMVLYRISEEHSFLIGRDEKAGNLWTFPVGKLEVGESPEEAARREFKEETGIECDELTFIDKVTWTDEKSVTYVTHIFHAIQSGGHSTVDVGELTEMKYAPFNVLEEYYRNGQGRKCLDFITYSTVREKVSKICLIGRRRVPARDVKPIVVIPAELMHVKESLERQMNQLQYGVEGVVKRELVSKIEEVHDMISTLKSELFCELRDMHAFNTTMISKVKHELLDELSEMHKCTSINDKNHFLMLEQVSKKVDKMIPDEKESIDADSNFPESDQCPEDDSDAEIIGALKSAKDLVINDDEILANSWKAVLKYAAGLDPSLQAQLIEKISAGNNELVSAICLNCDEDVEHSSDDDVNDKKESEDLSFEEKKAIFETKPVTTEELNESKMATMFKDCESITGKEWSYDGNLDHLTVGGLKIHIKVDSESNTPYVFTAKNSMPKKRISFFNVLEGKEYVECEYHTSPENHDVLTFVSTVFTRYIEEFNKANVVAV